MSPTDHETKCVLLAPSGKPCGVRGELERRGWTSHEVNDPLPAMAELCLLDRTRAVGRPDGSPVVERLAMVVVEPQQWPQLSAMLDAARRYVPHVSLWSYSNGSLTQLPADDGQAAVELEDVPSNDTAPSSHESASTLPEPPGVPPDDDPPQISADEIDMLLDEDDRTADQ